MKSFIEKDSIKEGAKGIAEIISRVRTFLSLAALSLIILLLLICFALYQSETKSEWLILATVIVGSISIILVLITSRKFKAFSFPMSEDSSYTCETGSLSKQYDYDIPSTLLVFSFGKVGEDGKVTLKTFRISTIRSLIDGDVAVKTIRRSQREILDSSALSTPLTTKSFGEGNAKGGTETVFRNLTKGQQEILALESTREITIGGKRVPADPEDTIYLKLREYLSNSKYGEAVGTRINVPTNRLRYLIYYPEGHLPKKINTILINEKGQISENIMRKELVEKDNLWITECEKPECVSSVYVCWIWKH